MGDFFPEGGGGSAITPGISVQQDPSMTDYYRQKVVEFQELLYNLQGAREGMIGLVDYGPDEIQGELTALLDQLDGKISQYKVVAESLNAAIAAYNAIGGNFPKLNTRGLGALPVVPIAIAGLVATAAGLIVWGKAWIDQSREMARQAQLYGYLTPQARSEVAAAALKIENAAKASSESALGSVANIAKWVSIAAVAYFAYQAFQKVR
jgi:hypothetical protein